MTIVFLAYNEEANLYAAVNIGYRVAKSQNLDFDLIIVNDGSTDGTAEVCRHISQELPNVTIIHNETNLGLGMSLRKAFRHANSEYVAWYPGDNDISPDLFADMFRAMRHADVTFTYFMNREFRGRLRNVISTAYCLAYTMTFNTHLLYLNGPGAYRTRVLKNLSLHGTRFGLIAELHIKLLRSGLSYIELPGYMLRGNEQGSALSLRNVIESIMTYFRLLWDVYVQHRSQFNKRPTRVHITRDFQMVTPIEWPDRPVSTAYSEPDRVTTQAS